MVHVLRTCASQTEMPTEPIFVVVSVPNCDNTQGTIKVRSCRGRPDCAALVEDLVAEQFLQPYGSHHTTLSALFSASKRPAGLPPLPEDFSRETAVAVVARVCELSSENRHLSLPKEG